MKVAAYQAPLLAARPMDALSYGLSAIVDPYGNVVRSARELTEDLLVADIPTTQSKGN